MQTYTVRNEAGNAFDVDEDKLDEAEKDGYLAVVSNGTEEHRVSKSDFPKAASDGYKPLMSSDVSEGDSGLRGAIDTLSLGFGDELGGHMEALGSKIGLRGIGSPTMSDIRLETDEEDKQSYSEVQEAMRDRRRALDKEAETANPKSFMAGQIAGGAAMPAGGALKGGSLAVKAAKLGAIEGGLYGAGSSEEEEALEIMKDAGKGALIGGASGLVGGKAMEKISEYAGKASRAAGDMLPDISAMKRGFKEAASEETVTEGIPANIEKIYKGIKGAFTEGGATKELRSEIAEQVAEARQILIKPLMESPNLSKLEVIANGKRIKAMSDDEVILEALMTDGENSVKRWISQRAAVEFPDNFSADQYNKILSMPAGQRIEARAFDKSKAGEQLKPVFEKTQASFKEARGEGWDALQNKARNEFTTEHTDKVLKSLDGAIEDANSMSSIPSGIKNLLVDAKAMIESGQGLRLHKLKKGALEEMDSAEHFTRLQKARELLDSKIKWAVKHDEDNIEKVLKGARMDIDEALKMSGFKAKGDDLWQASKEVENKFFGAIEFNKHGNIDIDQYKITKMLNDTDAAGRFRDSIDSLKTFMTRDDISDSFKGQGQELITKLESALEKSASQRDLTGFRYKQGPSSPAMERATAIMGDDSLVETAIRAPSGFVNQMDEFRKMVAEKSGKSLDSFDEKERSAMVKLWLLKKRKPDMSEAKFNQHFSQQFPGAARKEAIDEFNKQ